MQMAKKYKYFLDFQILDQPNYNSKNLYNSSMAYTMKMKGKIILPQAWVEASSPSSGGSAPNHMI
jgi:hypothetical protein